MPVRNGYPWRKLDFPPGVADDVLRYPVRALRAISPAPPDARRAGVRRPCIGARRRDGRAARLSRRPDRRPDAFQPVRTAARAALGPGLVRARLPLGALPEHG